METAVKYNAQGTIILAADNTVLRFTQLEAMLLLEQLAKAVHLNAVALHDKED